MKLSNNTIKRIRSLRSKKFRQKYNNFVVEGDKIAREALSQREWPVRLVFALADWVPPAAYTGEVTRVSERELGQLSQLKTPNQVLVVLEPRTLTPLPENWAASWSLYLDGLQAPGNLGAILRVADWFGIRYVFGGPGTADLYNAKTLQAAMGSFLRVDYREIDLAELLASSRDQPVVWGASAEGENVFSTDLGTGGLLVIGNEGQGIRPETARHVGRWLAIPRGPKGGAESLNAAVATGVLCSRLRIED
jgi:TrmH family RNA methyltransferase